MAEDRWPKLTNLLGCYFNQDLDILYGSVEGALDEAVRDGPTEYRRSILQEWRDWQARTFTDDVRSWLDCMGVDLLFKTSDDARGFMSHLYDRLIEQVRAETSASRRE